MQSQGDSLSGVAFLIEFNNHFPDLRLTPHLSYSPLLNTNFSPTLHHQPFILPKPNFYPQPSNMDETFAPTDQVLHFFADANNNSVPQFNIGQPNSKAKGKACHYEKSKVVTAQRGRKKKEGGGTQLNIGKRPAVIELKKEDDGKKPKIGEDTSSDLVISKQSIVAATGSIQSCRDE